MHQWGLVEDLLKQIIAEAGKHNLKKVTKIFLSLGKDDHLTKEKLKKIIAGERDLYF